MMRQSLDEQALWNDALRHGLHVARVREMYTIRDGMVLSSGAPKRHYIPMCCHELPAAIAKLRAGDEQAVLRFVRRYGQLGYSSLADGGEPLAWIWAHAAVIRVVFTVTALLQSSNDEALEAYIADIQWPLSSGDPETFGVIAEYVGEYQERIQRYNNSLAARGGIEHVPRGSEALEVLSAPRKVHLEGYPPLSLRNCARKIRYWLINQFMGPSYRQLWDKEEESPQSSYRLRNTLSVAYWLLADMIEQGEDARVRRCAECHAWFVQRDGRQRFCPAPEGVGKGESRCAARQRMRTHRQRRTIIGK